LHCCFVLTGESLVIRTQLHLLIVLREHLDNNLNSITEEGEREGGREREREREKLTLTNELIHLSDQLTYA
jgi:hypothetical protein